MTGPDSSMSTGTAATANVVAIGSSASIHATHSTWLTTMVATYVRQTWLRPGSWRDARSHWKTIATRITTYPMTITRVSRWSPSCSDSKSAGSPSARMSTPTICTIVVSRKIQSSVSYADANHAKLIHAHDTAKVAKANPMTPVAMCPSASACASSLADAPKAITNVRSKSSSNGVAARCGSCGSRPPMVVPWWCRESSMAGV